MMKHMLAGSMAALLGSVSVAASAQTVAIGTLPQGSLGYAVASAVASVSSDAADFRMRAVGLGGSNVSIPQTNSGDIQFSTSNTIEANYAYNGRGNFEGDPHRDIRMVTTLNRFQVGLMVRQDSDYQSLRDLAGEAMPMEYSSQKLISAFFDAFLAMEDMQVSDFQSVPVANFPRAVELLTEGRVEAALLAPGSSFVQRADADVGVRFISLPDSVDAEAAMQEYAPGSYLARVGPEDGIAGIKDPVTLMGYEYAILAHKDVSDEVVYQLVEALYNGKQGLVDSHGIFNSFDPDRMAVDVDVPFHEGAERFYREVGQWPPASVR